MPQTRKARRASITLTDEQLAELRRQQQIILTQERAELTAKVNKLRGRIEARRAGLLPVMALLKREREAQGLSLADVEARTGISRAALSRLENLADANPTISTLERVATAMGKRLVV